MKHDGNKYGTSESFSAAVHADDSLETVQSLELAITQINMALKEADDSIIELIGAMSSMAGCVQRIDTKLGELHQCSDTAFAVDELKMNCKQAETSMQQAVTAFQFYDRLSQRFLHINENLHAVSSVIKAPDQQHPALWKNLHDKVRSIYSLEQEQHMQQTLLNSLPDNKASKQIDPALEKSFSDIELF